MSRISGLAELIRLRTLRAEIAPGEGLVEQPLMAYLGVRRSSLREALRFLEGRGLLAADGSGGMRVVELDEDDLVETVHARAALEALRAALTAHRKREGELSAASFREGSGARRARPSASP